jgi:hypothetical protein
MISARLLPLERNKIGNIVRDRTTPPPYIDYKAQNWESSNVSVAPAENLLINIRSLSKKENTRNSIDNNVTRRIRKGDRHRNLKVNLMNKRPVWFQLLFFVLVFSFNKKYLLTYDESQTCCR